MYPEKTRNVSIMGDKLFVSLEAVKQEINVYDLSTDEWRNVPIEANNTILDEATNFVRAVKNRMTPINDGFNGSENIKVLECAVKSIREHSTIELEW